jgi:hypothetical protein
LLNPSPSLISTRCRPQPPVDKRHPASTQTPTPSCSDPAQAPHAAQPSTGPPWASPFGQHATDRPSIRHLAARPTLTQGINFPNQTRPSPTEHATPTKPIRRDRAARARRACTGVPVHQHLFQPHFPRTPAWHDIPDVMTTLPSPVEHHNDPAAHRFPCLATEPDAISCGTAIHRHHLRVPWNQLTTPFPDAAHGAQSRPRPPTINRGHPPV